MRQPKPSILWTLFRVWRVWRRCPTQRLGQLISNAIYRDVAPIDLFNLYDDSLVACLDDFADRHLP